MKNKTTRQNISYHIAHGLNRGLYFVKAKQEDMGKK